MKIVRLSIFVLLLLMSASFAVATDASAATHCDNNAYETTGTSTVVYFIDVGQGDSELIMTSDGKNILIDAGPQSSASAVTSFLMSHGATTLDALIISHPDADHLGGADEVLASATVRSIYHPGMAVGTQAYANFISAANAEGCPIYTNAEVNIGDYLPFGSSVTFRVMAINEHASSSNDASIVIKMTDGTVDFLFTGDASSVVESQMVANFGSAMDIDVLKVGHHGSSTSTSNAFLDATSPDVAVIEVGADNSYGHPTADALSRLSAHGTSIYRTDIGGTIATTSGSTFPLNGAMMPTAPQNFQGVPYSSQVSLRWDAPSSDGGAPIIGYELYRSTTYGGTFSPVASPSGTTYVDIGLTCGQTYWYKVSAINLMGEGELCSAISATTLPGDYTYTVVDGKATVTGYRGIGGAITIPTILDGYQTVAIGDCAFQRCTTITSVTIPGCVKIIGGDAFNTCTQLTSVTIESGVTTIEYDAFSACKSLTSVTIADSVTSIGSYAFQYCSALTSMTLGNGVTSIENGQFSFCTSLTSITIPDSVTSIGNFAFEYCTALIFVMMPNDVTYIGDGAFIDCGSLASIAIPDNVTYIGAYAFQSCSSLESVTIPDGVISIGRNTFYNCTSLTSVSIGSSVTSIGPWAFYYCTSLTTVTIPDGVTSVEQSAFYYCTGLASVSIGNSVATIGPMAFSYCTSLLSVNMPDSVETIGSMAFSYCTSIKSMIVGSGLTSIPGGMFYSCTSLASVNIPDTISIIENAAFGQCTSLTSIRIPDGITFIGDEAFYNCSALVAISIPNNVTYIGNWTFYSCNSMTSINIGSGVEVIGGFAFSECISIVSVIIPDRVSILGNYAFVGCTSLVSISLGKSIMDLPISSLSCISLTSISVDSGNSRFASLDGTLYSKDMAELILCPKGKTGALTIPTNVTAVRDQAFYASAITSVTIPDSVTSIGHESFYSCPSLVSVTLGCGISSIGYRAFGACYSLSRLQFEGNAPSYASGWIDWSPNLVIYFFNSATGFTTPTWEGVNTKCLYVPSAPQSLHATEGSAHVVLDWEVPESIGDVPLLGYRIYYGTTPTPNVLFSTVSNTILTADITGLTPGTLYYFGVKAINVTGNSILSNIESAIPYGVPDAPILVDLVPGHGSLTITYAAPINTAGSPITGYNLYWDNTSPPMTYRASYGPSINSIEVMGLIAGTRYYLTVTAVNLAGESTKPLALSAVPYTTPGTPTPSRVTAGPLQLSIMWTPPLNTGHADLTAFHVYYGANPESLDLFTTVNDRITSINVTGLTAGTLYYVAVSAVNPAGEGPISTALGGTPYTVPDAPTLTSAIAGSSSVRLTWSPNGNGSSAITGYKIFFGTLIPDRQFNDEISSLILGIEVTGLQAGVEYCFGVKAVNEAGTGPISNFLEALPYGIPGAPTSLHANSGNCLVALDWIAPESDGGRTIDFYIVYQDGIDTTHPTSTNVTLIGLSNGRAYSFSVAAHNVAGIGVRSTPSTSTPSTFPDVPLNMMATAGIGQVTVSWQVPTSDGGSPITGFKIYRMFDGNSSLLNTVSAGTLTYVDTTGTPEILYDYYVEAVNSIGSGAATVHVSASPQKAITTDNTALYAGVAIVAVVIIAIAAVLMRRKK